MFEEKGRRLSSCCKELTLIGFSSDESDRSMGITPRVTASGDSNPSDVDARRRSLFVGWGERSVGLL